MAVGDPSITGCTDNLGGTDTITTKGKWELQATKSRKQVTVDLVIAKNRATFVSSVISSCKVIATGGPVAATYNRTNGTATSTRADIPVKGMGCSASKDSTETTTITFSPNPGKIPPFAS